MKVFKIGDHNILLDDEDLERVKEAERTYETKWFVVRPDKHVQLKAGTSYIVQLGRFLLNYDGPFFIDHKNRNPLDNQKENLRVATRGLNRLNAKLNKNNTSGITGVRICTNSINYPWIAVLGRKCLGYFKTKEEAVVARNKALEAYGPSWGDLHEGTI